MSAAPARYISPQPYSSWAQLHRDCTEIRECIRLLAESHAKPIPAADCHLAESRSNSLLAMLDGNLRRLEDRGHLSAADAAAWRAYAEYKRIDPPLLRQR